MLPWQVICQFFTFIMTMFNVSTFSLSLFLSNLSNSRDGRSSYFVPVESIEVVSVKNLSGVCLPLSGNWVLAKYAYLGPPNMVKWGVPENILQNAVQTC